MSLSKEARDEELTALYRFKWMHVKYIPVRIAEKYAPQVTYLTWMTLVTVFWARKSISISWGRVSGSEAQELPISDYMLLPAPKIPSLVMNNVKLSPQATSSTLRPLSKKKVTRLICWTLTAMDSVLPPLMTVELGIPYYPQWLSPRVKTTPSSVRMNMWDAPKISFFTRQSSKAGCAFRVILTCRP